MDGKRITEFGSSDEQQAPGTEPDTDDGVDVSLIRRMLSLTPAERLDALQGFVDAVASLGGEGAFGQIAIAAKAMPGGQSGMDVRPLLSQRRGI